MCLQVDIEQNRKNRKLALDEQKRREIEEAEAAMDDEEIEEVDSDEWDEMNPEDEGDPIPRTDCFFCMHHSSTLEKNAIHMSTDHSFFVPDVEYLIDLPGLFEYLGAKVINSKFYMDLPNIIHFPSPLLGNSTIGV